MVNKVENEFKQAGNATTAKKEEDTKEMSLAEKA